MQRTLPGAESQTAGTVYEEVVALFYMHLQLKVLVANFQIKHLKKLKLKRSVVQILKCG